MGGFVGAVLELDYCASLGLREKIKINRANKTNEINISIYIPQSALVVDLFFYVDILVVVVVIIRIVAVYIR